MERGRHPYGSTCASLNFSHVLALFRKFGKQIFCLPTLPFQLGEIPSGLASQRLHFPKVLCLIMPSSTSSRLFSAPTFFDGCALTLTLFLGGARESSGASIATRGDLSFGFSEAIRSSPISPRRNLHFPRGVLSLCLPRLRHHLGHFLRPLLIDTSFESTSISSAIFTTSKILLAFTATSSVFSFWSASDSN